MTPKTVLGSLDDAHGVIDIVRISDAGESGVKSDVKLGTSKMRIVISPPSLS